MFYRLVFVCVYLCMSMGISLADQMIAFLYVKKAIIIYILLCNLLFSVFTS